MNKRSGLPSAERAGEPSFISRIREELEARKSMYEAVGSDPDFSDTWNSDDFKKLSPDDQDALKREFGAAVEPRLSAEDEKALGELKEELEVRKSMYEAVGNAPDYSDTWNSDAFKALSKDAQDKLRAEFSDAAPPPERTAPEKGPRPEQKEKDRAKPPRRVFVSYGIAQSAESREYQVVENYKEYDDRQDDYVFKKRRTRIELPPGLLEEAEKKPELISDLASYCERFRNDLEKRGVKLYLDRPKDETDFERERPEIRRVFPKWKYYVDNKMFEEQIRPEDLPPEILELAQRDQKYYDRPAWKKWFGRMRQSKIEEIVSEGLTRLAAEKAPRREPAAVREEAPVRETAAAGIDEAEEIIESEIRTEKEKKLNEAALASYMAKTVETLSDLYPLPENMDKFLENLRTFARSFCDVYEKRPGMPDEAKLTPDEVSAVILAELRARFSDRKDVIDAIKSAEPAAEDVKLAEQKEAAKEINVQAEMEVQFSQDYKDLRQETNRLRSEDDFDAFQKKLEGLATDPSPQKREAASTLLIDIERGRIGPASEMRRAGVERTPEEERYFEAHPLLDRRNAELMPDGRLVVYLDRMRANDSLSRAVRLLVLDALSEDGHVTKHDEDKELLIQQINTYVFKVLGRRKADQVVAQRFKNSVAELNFKTGELIIKDGEKLTDIIKKLAEKLKKEGS